MELGRIQQPLERWRSSSGECPSATGNSWRLQWRKRDEGEERVDSMLRSRVGALLADRRTGAMSGDNLSLVPSGYFDLAVTMTSTTVATASTSVATASHRVQRTRAAVCWLAACVSRRLSLVAIRCSRALHRPVISS